MQGYFISSCLLNNNLEINSSSLRSQHIYKKKLITPNPQFIPCVRWTEASIIRPRNEINNSFLSGKYPMEIGVILLQIGLVISWIYIIFEY